jgi:hypothetical protein
MAEKVETENTRGCGECGLPIAICNSLATYQRGVMLLQRGRVQDANYAFESAKEFHDAWLAKERQE